MKQIARTAFLMDGNTEVKCVWEEDAVRRNDLGTPHCAMRQSAWLEVTLAAADVMRSCGEVRRQTASVSASRE
jgi:hypothetical protein